MRRPVLRILEWNERSSLGPGVPARSGRGRRGEADSVRGRRTSGPDAIVDVDTKKSGGVVVGRA